MHEGPVLLAFSLALFFARDACADDGIRDGAATPWDALGDNVVDAFTGWNVLYYGGAIAGTGAMAFGSGDQAVRVLAQRHLASRAYGDAAYWTGYILPAVAAPVIWLVGLGARNARLTGGGSAAIQALTVTVATTAVLKWATGRPFPNHGGDPRDPTRLDHDEYAREFSFQPLTLNRGLAWPSGHTSSTVAIAASLTAYYDDVPWVPFVTYPIALAVGVGMIDGDHHWASDVLAGALIGQAIGGSIGRSFRHRANGGRRDDAPGSHTEHIDVELVPFTVSASSSWGLMAVGKF